MTTNSHLFSVRSGMCSDGYFLFYFRKNIFFKDHIAFIFIEKYPTVH